MTRPATLVVRLTYLALIAATLWLPCEVWYSPADSGGIASTWGLVWFQGVQLDDVTFGDFSDWEWRSDHRVAVIAWRALALEYALILAIGGLTALALQRRERRRDGDDAAAPA